ncbi:MAG: hypothetical protein LUH82_06560, partial [Clostridiales bacterium]|nr:hypothetical protein [Clostridiales bacterium]
MRKKFRKTLSFFLAFLMLLTSINAGLTALAADLDEDDSAATEETTALDESYDALIEAMEDSYVTSAEYVYDAEAQSVTVADNDEAAIQTAAQAFYAVLTQLDYTESDIASLAAEICETLAAEMEDAFTDDMQSVITKYFTGLGDSESVDNEDEYTFTVEITPNARVAEYTSVDELPDVLPSSETFTYVHEGFSVLLISSYSLASVSDSLAEEEAEEEAEDADEAEDVDADVDVEETADEAVDETADEENAQAETPAEDTEFPAALKAYAQYFSAEALAVDYSELSADELLALCGSGQAAIDAVQQISAEKQAEFYETAVEDAQAYLDGALAYSVSAFKSAVAEAAALVQGRAYDSFSLDELAAVEELTAGAAAAYEVYTDSQKAAVASEYAVLQSVQALYDEAFAYASKLAYMEAVAALQEAETGSAEGTAEPVEDTTEPAESTTEPAESTTDPADTAHGAADHPALKDDRPEDQAAAGDEEA